MANEMFRHNPLAALAVRLTMPAGMRAEAITMYLPQVCQQAHMYPDGAVRALREALEHDDMFSALRFVELIIPQISYVEAYVNGELQFSWRDRENPERHGVHSQNLEFDVPHVLRRVAFAALVYISIQERAGQAA